MKRAAALLSILVLAACNAAPPAKPKAKAAETAKLEGMEYDKARHVILGYGWKPFPGECQGPPVDESTCRKYPELGYCRGTGDGTCDMSFARKDRCLIILTRESPPGSGGDTVVTDVTFLRRACEKPPF